MRALSRFAADESGMSPVEYALVAAVFAVGLVGVLSLLGWTFPRLLGRMAPPEQATIAP